MKRSFLIILSSALVITIMTYLIGGSSLLTEGFRVSLNTALQSALMLVASFLVIGQIQVLLSKEVLDQWLQRFSGIKGVVMSALAGGLFPGGPYIYYPFVVSFKGKDIPFYIIISFLYGKMVFDVTRIPMEISLVSPTVALVRNIITFPIPIIVGLIAERYLANRTMDSFLEEIGDADGSNHDNS
ncbi:MAG: hypothetical protein GX251_07950 [Firmicutes bacterium]|nr:hypothetical protein [Bacillota bacterium]